MMNIKDIDNEIREKRIERNNSKLKEWERKKIQYEIEKLEIDKKIAKLVEDNKPKE